MRAVGLSGLRAVERLVPAICNAVQRAPHPSLGDGRVWWVGGVSATVLDDPRLRHQLPRYTLGVRGFYRRPLPSPPAIPFASTEGKQMFKEALELGGMEGYFRTLMQPGPFRSCLPQPPASALPTQFSSRIHAPRVLRRHCSVAGLAGQFVTQMEPAFCGLVRAASFLRPEPEPKAPGVKGVHYGWPIMRWS
jgi:hypothetical protein